MLYRALTLSSCAILSLTFQICFSQNLTDGAIVAHNITKSFGNFRAVDDVSFVVQKGAVLGLLDQTARAKTTIVRILSTLTAPDGGRVSVAGFDVATQPLDVRKRIGLAGQAAAIDEMLTGLENLR